ncbi:MAG: ketoacyl-ACP synthase III [Bacteroidetes bacterium]|nr:MAG: ketoacyl-ACP synthase III [Bacteroidota bacterium]
MEKKIRAAITAIQGYVPDYILTNAELERMVDTTDEWIVSRTGIKERRLLKGENMGTSFMGIKAAQQLLEKTSTDPLEIDLLICATVTPDFVFPATANLIAHAIGANNAFNYDLQAACSGFLYALVTASQFIETGKYKKILVVGADKMSSIIDYTDRSTCIIFGDGAGAILLEPNTEGNGVIDSVLRSDGAGQEHLYMKAGGSRKPPSIESIANKEHFVTQDGAAVYKSAVKYMSEAAAEIMQRNNLSADDVAYLVPHQANKRIIEATANRMGIGADKVLINIQRYGNTTSGTIPLCMWDNEAKFKKGDNLVLAAFGGGFTWGSVFLKWAY